MTAFTTFQAVTLTAGEQSALAAIGMTGEDGNGVLHGIQIDLAEINVKLARITANIGAGTNLTNINAYVTAALT